MDDDRAIPWLRDKRHNCDDAPASLGTHREVKMDLSFPIYQIGGGEPCLFLSVVVAKCRRPIASHAWALMEVRGVCLANGTLVDAPDMEPEGTFTVDAHHEGRRSRSIERIRSGRRQVAQIITGVGPGHARDVRTSTEAAAAKMRVPMEILITRIGSAGSEQQGGCSQASNCHGTETGHNVLSET